MVGGRVQPLKCDYHDPDHVYSNEPIWIDGPGEFRYAASTGDPTDTYRHWIGDFKTDDRRALRNPQWGDRTYASWDDHGELHPFDGQGPDLFLRLPIPEGLYRVALYFVDWDWWEAKLPRGQRLTISDETGQVWCTGQVAAFGGGVYKVYGVQGPRQLIIRIHKDASVSCVLSGIFLDRWRVPEAVSQGNGEDSPTAAETLRRYEQWRHELAASNVTVLRAFRDCGVLWQDFQQLPPLLENPARRAEVKWAQWQIATLWPPYFQQAQRLFQEYVEALQRGRSEEEVLARLVGLRDQAFQEQRWAEAEMAMDEYIRIRSAELESGLGSLIEAIQQFRRRDVEYARAKVLIYCERVAELSGQEAPSRLLQFARELADLAAEDWKEGQGLVRTTYRLPATVLQWMTERWDEAVLGSSGHALLVQSLREQVWYHMGWRELITAGEKFLTRYETAPERPGVLLSVLNAYGVLAQGEPEQYLPKMEALAAVLTKEYPESEAAADAALAVAKACQDEGYPERARRFYREVIERYPESVQAARAQGYLEELEAGSSDPE